MADIVILGAGIAGLGASYALYNRSEKSVIFEKDSTYGGLCGNELSRKRLWWAYLAGAWNKYVANSQRYEKTHFILTPRNFKCDLRSFSNLRVQAFM